MNGAAAAGASPPARLAHDLPGRDHHDPDDLHLRHRADVPAAALAAAVLPARGGHLRHDDRLRRPVPDGAGGPAPGVRPADRRPRGGHRLRVPDGGGGEPVLVPLPADHHHRQHPPRPPRRLPGRGLLLADVRLDGALDPAPRPAAVPGRGRGERGRHGAHPVLAGGAPGVVLRGRVPGLLPHGEPAPRRAGAGDAPGRSGAAPRLQRPHHREHQFGPADDRLPTAPPRRSRAGRPPTWCAAASSRCSARGRLSC